MRLRLFSLLFTTAVLVAGSGCSASGDDGSDSNDEAISTGPTDALFAALAKASPKELTPLEYRNGGSGSGGFENVQSFTWKRPNAAPQKVTESTTYEPRGQALMPVRGNTTIGSVTRVLASSTEAWQKWDETRVYTRWKTALLKDYAAAPISAFLMDEGPETKAACDRFHATGIGFAGITSPPARFRWKSALGDMVVCDYSGGALFNGGVSEGGAVGVVEKNSGMALSIFISASDGVLRDEFGPGAVKPTPRAP